MTGSNDSETSARRIAELERELADLRGRYAGAQALGRVVQATAAARDLDGAFATVCRELAMVFGLPQVALALFEADRSSLLVVAEHCAPGFVPGLGERIPVAGNPITEYVIAHRQPMVVADAQHDERLGPVRELMARRGTASIMIVPILIAGEVEGTIGLDSPTPREFRDAEVELARDIALALSQALANARLYQGMLRELAQREQAQAQLRAQALTLDELATPLIPLSAGVLLLPLVGAIDARRGNQVLEVLLEGIARHQAETAIIDITGVRVVDTQVADGLLRAARAARLLGARVHLSGISPEIAQTLVQLGADLDQLDTSGSLQATIAAALGG